MPEFDYQQLDEVIHSRIRLAIMAVLVSVDEASRPDALLLFFDHKFYNRAPADEHESNPYIAGIKIAVE